MECHACVFSVLQESGVSTPADTKEVQQASRRSSGIANMFSFRQRQSMDTGVF